MKYLILILTAALSACGGGGEIAPGPVQKPIIECYGESTMYGWAVPVDKSIPAQLQAMLPGYIVANEGVPSTTAKQMLDGTDGKHLPWAKQMQQSGARFVIINRGINDADRNVPTDVFIDQMNEIVQIALAAGKNVILQSPNATITGTRLDASVERLAATVCKIRDVFCSDGFGISKIVPEYLADGLHPDVGLYKAMASDLVKYVRLP